MMESRTATAKACRSAPPWLRFLPFQHGEQMLEFLKSRPTGMGPDAFKERCRRGGSRASPI